MASHNQLFIRGEGDTGEPGVETDENLEPLLHEQPIDVTEEYVLRYYGAPVPSVSKYIYYFGRDVLFFSPESETRFIRYGYLTEGFVKVARFIIIMSKYYVEKASAFLGIDVEEFDKYYALIYLYARGLLSKEIAETWCYASIPRLDLRHEVSSTLRFMQLGVDFMNRIFLNHGFEGILREKRRIHDYLLHLDEKMFIQFVRPYNYLPLYDVEEDGKTTTVSMRLDNEAILYSMLRQGRGSQLLLFPEFFLKVMSNYLVEKTYTSFTETMVIVYRLKKDEITAPRF